MVQGDEMRVKMVDTTVKCSNQTKSERACVWGWGVGGQHQYGRNVEHSLSLGQTSWHTKVAEVPRHWILGCRPLSEVIQTCSRTQ